MKKFLCLFLAVITILLSLAGCTPSQQANDPQPEEEKKIFKVLLIGQSLGQDTVWFLQQVMKTEMPDQEFLVADIYKSLALGDHRRNIQNNAAVYSYLKFNDTGYVRTENATILSALQDEWWDLIIFNDATYPTTQEYEFKDGDHAFMINYIKENANPGFKLAYNATWANPTDAMLWGSDDRPNAQTSVLTRFKNVFGGSRNLYYDKICANIKKYIETNEEFDYVFHTGTAIQYASEIHGVPEADILRDYELYRDYVHLGDFGRLLVAYQVYAQIFGLTKLESVNVNLIKQKMRHTSSQMFGDLEITQKHKDAIIASVNYALQHPNEVPPQTARAAAILQFP